MGINAKDIEIPKIDWASFRITRGFSTILGRAEFNAETDLRNSLLGFLNQFPRSWEDAHAQLVAPLLEKRFDTDLILAPKQEIGAPPSPRLVPIPDNDWSSVCINIVDNTTVEISHASQSETLFTLGELGMLDNRSPRSFVHKKSWLALIRIAENGGWIERSNLRDHEERAKLTIWIKELRLDLKALLGTSADPFQYNVREKRWTSNFRIKDSRGGRSVGWDGNLTQEELERTAPFNPTLENKFRTRYRADADEGEDVAG